MGRIDLENIEILGIPKRLNYEEAVRQLDAYYGIVKRKILQFQSPTTGLFPAFSQDKKVGSVFDSIYSATAIWTLYQAYRRVDDDRGRSYELGQSTVKCLRGILLCWLRQADRIEKFKQNQSSNFALHCKFDLETGNTVFSDDEYFHLQIDVVSLYLIFLVQIISSNLQIIYTRDEVCFIQNLVYYVERAYRTPDYGIWERGTKYNEGVPEIHASSIGLAKAAIEAVNGFNLFGDKGSSWSVIYVDIDAHYRNRSIFEIILPRESSSKNTDVSLLPTISFPAFATHNETIYKKTKEKIIKKLQGNYGFKRFVRDGFRTELEDPTKRFYSPGMTQDFENIESEWPIFYFYFVIDGFFKGLPHQIEEYYNLAKERIIRDSINDPIVPMCYYIDKGSIKYEKESPGTQIRWPSKEGSENNIFLWGQSMFVITNLLMSGLISIQEIDLIRRYQPAYNRPWKERRYTAFQGTGRDTVVQIVLIAESARLQAMMATYGIQCQTPHEVEPVQIWPPNELVKVYEKLGVNKKLNLGGRPPRPIGSLGTSKVYRIFGQTVLCYPLIFEVSDFYLSHDMQLLIDDIKNELHFVGKYWKLSGRPTMCLLIREEHMRDQKFKEMLDLYCSLKKGHCDGIKVRLGRVQNLLSSSCIEHLDFMNNIDPSQLNIKPFSQIVHEYSGYQSLTDIPKTAVFNEDNTDLRKWLEKPSWEIVEGYRCMEGFYGRCQLLGFLLKREGPHFRIDHDNILDHLIKLNRQCGVLRLWAAVRYCSSLLGQLVDSISPYITAVLVNGKQLTVGVFGHEEVVFDKPVTPAEISRAIYTKVQPYDVIQAVLQQEIALHCGKLLGTNPELFNGILKIRVGWVLQAIRLYMKITYNGNEKNLVIESCSPSEVRRLLHQVLKVKDSNSKINLSPFQRRQIEGCLCRVPENFYFRVWNILKKAPGGIVIEGQVAINQEPILSQMTASEFNFALIVEKMLHQISKPEYIQIVIELLCVVSTILSRNPELLFSKCLDVDKIIKSAFKMFQKDFKDEINKNNENGGEEEEEMYPFFNTQVSTTTGYLARAVVNEILQGDVSFNSDISQNEICNLV